MKRCVMTLRACVALVALPLLLMTEAAAAVEQEPVLVILAQLDNAVFPLHSTDQQDWVDLFFTQDADPPSMRDYFAAVSDGQLDLMPDDLESSVPAGNGVVGWYSLGHDLDYYVAEAVNNKLQHWSVVAAYDALRLPSVAKEVNYAAYDTDGNGIVEPSELHVYVVLSAYEADDSLMLSTQFTPVSQRLHAPALSYEIDGVQIQGVAVTGEMSNRDLPAAVAYQTKMGLFAHEMGHSLGWFDHYKGVDNVGAWCLMAGGDRGGDENYPNYPCAYARWEKGWYDVRTMEEPEVVSIAGVTAENDELFMIPQQWNGDSHFYLVENRQDQPENTFDGSLPGSGILVWEIDTTEPPQYNARLVRADDIGPGSGGGDPLPGSTDVRSLDCSTTPSLMDVRIASVSDAGASMTAELGREPASYFSFSSGSNVPANGFSRTRVEAVLMNDCISEVQHESRQVTFTIVSGAEFADLVPPTTVTTVGSRAVCSVQAGFTPGEVVIQATSPGLEPRTATVTVTPGPVTWHVAMTGSDVTGTGDPSAPFASVQRAVDAASNGETVLVAPGLYSGHIVIDSKNITLASHFTLDGDDSHIAATILEDGQPTIESIVSFRGSITYKGASLIGFTVRNGFAANGGGISCLEVSPFIDHCVIMGNIASSTGAGMYLHNSDAWLSNLLITNNDATYMDWSAGGGLASYGGTPHLEDIVIRGNSTNTYGGGLYFSGGGEPYLERVEVSGNSSNGRGGGIYCTSGASVSFFDSAIDLNTAAYIGGGVYCDGAQVEFHTSTITNNTASTVSTDVGGGGVFADNGATVFLVNATLTGNLANTGGGLQLREGTTTAIVNSILWGNSQPELYVSAGGAQSSITVTHSDIQGGETGIQTNGNAYLNWRSGNIDQDPGFSADATGNPFALGLGSPCIDRGIAAYFWGPDALLDLEPYQYSGAAPDMGATEFPSVLVVVSPDGSSGYSSISEALNDVPNGTIIELMDGTYTGNGNVDIDFQGRSIVLRSRSRDEGRCVIDCRDTTGQTHRAFHFHSGEGPGAVVEGVTIIYGGAADKSLPGGEFGGGVLCENSSSPTFRNVTFAGCSSDSGGGALACVGSSPTVENCTFYANTAPAGSSLHCVDSSPRVTNSLLVLGTGETVFVDATSAPEFTCTDIFGNTGGDWTGTLLPLLGVGGNISEDPLFCEPDPLTMRNWGVTNDSPCLPENSTTDCTIGAWAGGCIVLANFLSNFTVQLSDLGPQISWHTATASDPGEFRLVGTSGGLSWTIPHRQVSPFTFEALDTGDRLGAEGPVTYILSHLSDGRWIQVGSQEFGEMPLGLATRIVEIYPNPFNPELVVEFATGKPGPAKIGIFDVAGRLVASLHDGQLAAGRHSRNWTGRDRSGRAVSSGVYFVRLATAAKTETRKVMLLR